MHNSFDASTVIFALLAIFVVWKLRSVLGTRVGLEKRRDGASTVRPAGADTAARDVGAPAQPLPGAAPPANLDAPTLAASRGLDEIRRVDRSFDVPGFVNGAQGAYRMIIEAFAKGDRATLNNLLGDEALRTFTAALDARGSEQPPTLSQVADIEKVQIVGASCAGSNATVTVRFKAHIAEVPAPGAPQPAASGGTSEANDLWTFARDVRSADPNWKLVATATDDGEHV